MGVTRMLALRRLARSLLETRKWISIFVPLYQDHRHTTRAPCALTSGTHAASYAYTRIALHRSGFPIETPSTAFIRLHFRAIQPELRLYVRQSHQPIPTSKQYRLRRMLLGRFPSAKHGFPPSVRCTSLVDMQMDGAFNLVQAFRCRKFRGAADERGDACRNWMRREVDRVACRRSG